jgi:hypothetical protein
MLSGALCPCSTLFTNPAKKKPNGSKIKFNIFALFGFPEQLDAIEHRFK